MSAISPMDCWSADLMGPFSQKGPEGEFFHLPTLKGERYCLLVVDNASRYCMVDFLSKKSDAFEKLIEMIRQKQNQLGKKLKRLHTDSGGEFKNDRLVSFLREEGIEMTNTTTATSEHNGIVERMNQKMEEYGRSLLIGSDSPPELWGYAIQHSVTIHNHSASSALKGETPIGMFHSLVPSSPEDPPPIRTISALNLNDLKVFGCDAFVLVSDDKRGKFDQRTANGIYIGYSRQQNAHRILMCDSLSERVERNVTFNEQSFTHLSSVRNQIEWTAERRLGENSAEDTEVRYEVERLINERTFRGKQQYLVKWKGYRHPTWESTDNLTKDCPDIVRAYQAEKKSTHPHALHVSGIIPNDSPSHMAFTSVINYPIPNTYAEAIRHKDSAKWAEAIDKELKSIIDNDTWEPAVLPKGRHPLSTRWVFTVKHNDLNEIQRWKARLVVRGFLQRFGLDYDETFAPTVAIKTLKYMFAMAAQQDMEIMQIDFDTAFLHASLEEEIYIRPPQGFDMPTGHNTSVLKLLKSLYGLKQAPREWYKSVSAALNRLGYFASDLDECLFMKCQDGARIYATIYVDDVLFFFPKSIQKVWEDDKEKLSSEFKIKDIGECSWILNMSITRDRQRGVIELSQENYVDLMLSEFPPSSDRLVSSPYKWRDITVESEGMNATPLDKENHSKYRSIVGQLLWISIVTRPDISHIVGLLTRYVSSPLQYHMDAADRVLQYLMHHRSERLIFSRNASKAPSKSFDFVVWTDSDWADERCDRKSITGNISTLNGCPIWWKSKKQSTIALSAGEAECYALADAIREALFLRQWLEHYFGITQQIVIKGDNDGSHKFADHPTDHEKTKHYDLKSLFTRDHIKDKTILLEHVSSSENIADILTKYGVPKKFQYLKSLLF